MRDPGRANNDPGASEATRVLVGIEPRSYRMAVGSAIGQLRPDTEVRITEPEALTDAVRRFRPHVVFGGRPRTEGAGEVLAWAELHFSSDEQVARIWIEDRRVTLREFDLSDLLSVVDRVAALRELPPPPEDR